MTVRGDIGGLRRMAENLRGLDADRIALEVAERSAGDVAAAARRAYPEEHVRTGRTLRSITAEAAGPSVVVTAGTPYARFVPGLFEGVAEEAEPALDATADVVLDAHLEPEVA